MSRYGSQSGIMGEKENSRGKCKTTAECGAGPGLEAGDERNGYSAEGLADYPRDMRWIVGLFEERTPPVRRGLCRKQDRLFLTKHLLGRSDTSTKSPDSCCDRNE